MQQASLMTMDPPETTLPEVELDNVETVELTELIVELTEPVELVGLVELDDSDDESDELDEPEELEEVGMLVAVDSEEVEVLVVVGEEVPGVPRLDESRTAAPATTRMITTTTATAILDTAPLL